MYCLKRILSISLIFFATEFSCSNHKTDIALDQNDSHQLTQLNLPDKVINLDSLTSSNSGKYSYLTNSKGTILYILNQLNNSIGLYNWSDGKFVKNIKLSKEGPNGVQIITNFFVKSPDSIFVLSTYAHKLSLVDSTGSLLKNYSLFLKEGQDKEEIGSGIISYGDEANKMQVIDDHLYVGATPFDDPAILRYYEKGRYGLDLNLSTGSKATLMAAPIHWVDKYKDGYRLTSQENLYGQDYNINKETAIISFLTENYVYEVNLKTHRVQKHLAKSRLLDEIPWMKRNVTGSDQEFEFFINSSFYPAIYYDPYRKVYLRFTAHYNSNKKDKYDGRPWVNFSIILLNEKFETIGESFLPEKFCSHLVVITKDAIYLKNCTNIEDKISLTPFEIKEKNNKIK